MRWISKIGLISIMLVILGLIGYQNYIIKENKGADKQVEVLPSIVIDIQNQKLHPDEAMPIEGVIQIYEMGLGSNRLDMESNIEIKIRGRSSRRYPKKQYYIQLIDEQGNSRNEEVLGMPKESDWVLNGSYIDRSMMRNYIAYHIAGKIMPYAPRAKFCEVYLIDDGADQAQNQHYQGVYLFIEKIKRDDNRVDIKKVSSQYEEVSYLLQRNDGSGNDMILGLWGNETGFTENKIQGIYPASQDLTMRQIRYIVEDVSQFEKVLYSANYDDPKEGYIKYIDVNSFIDYFLINEYLENGDGGSLSTYFYKDIGGKITVGPVWDFDSAMGNYQWHLTEEEIKKYEQESHEGFVMVDKSWFDKLFQDAKFVEQTIARYEELRKTYLSDDYITNVINQTEAILEEAASKDDKRWKNHLEKEMVKVRTHDEDIEYLKAFLIKRGRWLDKHIEELYY